MPIKKLKKLFFDTSHINQKIISSTLIQYAAKGTQLILSVITLKLISNFLNDAGYSMYASITEIALFFSTIGNLGIFGNIVRTMSEAPRDSKIFTQALILRLLTSAILFSLAIIILFFTNNNPIFLLGSALFLGVIFFDYITSVCDAMLQANYLMGRATTVLLIGRFINLGLIFLVIKFSQNIITNNIDNLVPAWPWLPLILTSSIIASLVTALLSLFLVRQQIKFSWGWDSKLLKILLLSSLPFGIINIINSLYFRFLPDYFAHQTLNDLEFNSFNINFRIAQVLSLASTFLMFSALPGIKEYLHNRQFNQAKLLIKRITIILSTAGLAIVIIGSLIGPQLIELLTHKKYTIPEFSFLFPMMLILAATSYGYDLVLITNFSLNQEKWFLKNEVIALVISLILFAASTLPNTNQIQLFLILSAAITGEIYMVIRGFQNIQKSLQSLH